jgi:hypothetical protein
VPADLRAGVGERAQIALEPPGKRVVDDGGDRDPAQGRVDALPGLDAHLVDEGQRALDLHARAPAPAGTPAPHLVSKIT